MPAETSLKKLNLAELNAGEQETLRWLQRQLWQPTYAGSGSLVLPVDQQNDIWRDRKGANAAEIEELLHKFESSGVIGPQEPYIVKGVSAPISWYITLKKEELSNIGITVREVAVRDGR